MYLIQQDEHAEYPGEVVVWGEHNTQVSWHVAKGIWLLREYRDKLVKGRSCIMPLRCVCTYASVAADCGGLLLVVSAECRLHCLVGVVTI